MWGVWELRWGRLLGLLCRFEDEVAVGLVWELAAMECRGERRVAMDSVSDIWLSAPSPEVSVPAPALGLEEISDFTSVTEVRAIRDERSSSGGSRSGFTS